MKSVRVKLKDRSYNILVGAGIISRTGVILKKIKSISSAYIITNSKIKSLFGKKIESAVISAGLRLKFYIIKDSEKSKSAKVWLKALGDLAHFDKGSGVAVIALGGGVIGDLAGFVASTYRRGVPFIQVPTTLLAQVDSAIGGKVAVDTDFAKNLVGAFYQPRVVISDINTLDSLSPRQIRNGLAEIIKYGVILDRNLFLYLEKNLSNILKLKRRFVEQVVVRCSKLKADVVSLDEQESHGYRSILNFGHTIGHAIETATSYKGSILHGEAISIGMLSAFDIAVWLNLTASSTADRFEALIKKAGLPTHVKGVSISQVVKAISYDKKIIKGKKRWVLPVDIGHIVICHCVEHSIILKVLAKRCSP